MSPDGILRKGNGTCTKKLSDELIMTDLVDDNPEKSMERIKSAMIQCAQRTIPRGQVKRHRPFWNATLTVLKRNRNNAQKIAERSGRYQDCINLKRKRAQLLQAIIQGKRTAYRSFISRIDFRKDGIKGHRFVSNLNNLSRTR
jgi:hypothetical protein